MEIFLELCEAQKNRKNKTEGRSSFLPVGHGCTRFGSHEESEFKRLFLHQFFTLRTVCAFHEAIDFSLITPRLNKPNKISLWFVIFSIQYLSSSKRTKRTNYNSSNTSIIELFCGEIGRCKKVKFIAKQPAQNFTMQQVFADVSLAVG